VETGSVTYSDEETARIAEFLTSLKTSTRDVALVIADYDGNGDATMSLLATHESLDDAVDQMLHVVECELEIDEDDSDDDDQPELPFVEKATLQ
jgi:hypothetical protein